MNRRDNAFLSPHINLSPSHKLLFWIAGSALLFVQAFAQSRDSVESLVTKQISTGRVADLRTLSPQNRTLRAEFIARLLSDTLRMPKLPKEGIRIKNAVIEGELDLDNAVIPSEVWLDSCDFNSDVTFVQASFGRDLSFDGSRFHDAVDFERLSVQGILHLSSTVFESSVDFTSMHISRDVDADSAQFKDDSEDVDWSGTRVDGDLMLTTARFEGPVSLEELNVGGTLLMDSVVMLSSLDLIDAKIGKDLSADDGTFTEEADFSMASVGGLVFMRRAKFKGEVSFLAASVPAGDLLLDRSIFSSKDKEVSFDRVKVGGILSCDRCTFRSLVKFDLSTVGVGFSGDSSRFLNSTYALSFDRATIHGNLALRGSVIAGRSTFARLVLDGNLLAENLRTTGNRAVLDFNSMNCSGSVFLGGSELQGPTLFTWASIKGSFSADSTRFVDSSKGPCFSINSAQIGQLALMRGAQFHGSVDFIAASIGSSLDMTGARFLNPRSSKTFWRAKIANDVFLNHVTIAGSVDFRSMEVKGDLYATGAELAAGPRDTADFGDIKIDGALFLRQLRTRGTLRIAYANLSDVYVGRFSARYPPGRESSSVTLNLSEASIKRELLIDSFQVRNLFMRSSEVQGIARFVADSINGNAQFENSTFSTLSFQNVIWPEHPSSINFSGMKYKSISNDSTQESVLALVSRSSFHSDVFSRLESFFKDAGSANLADKTYIDQRDLERDRLCSEHNYLSWILQTLFLKWPTDYGRSPSRALLISIGFVMIGMLVFRTKSGMELQMGPDSPDARKLLEKDTPYSAFWYSLDLFLPLIGLQAADHWIPLRGRRYAWLYMRVHRILGWLLIPIGLAAWTGIVK